MDRAAFSDGLRDTAPAVPPNVPLGMLFGATAVGVGIDPVQATAMSLFSFAATAQIAAVDLLQGGTALPVVLATVLVINLRYVVFSASLAPEVDHLSRRWRALVAYPLFDVTYALAAARFDAEDETAAENGVDGATADGAGDTVESASGSASGSAPEAGASTADGDTRNEGGHRGWYCLGTGLPLVATFAASTLAGALAGRTFGAGLHLDFAIPLIFLALLVPALDGRASVLGATVAAAVAIAASGIPFNAGLLVGILAGTAAGAFADRATGGSQ